MHRISQDSMVYYQFESLSAYPALKHGIFTRLGGKSLAPFNSLNVGATVGDNLTSVHANRHKMAEVLGLRDEDTRTTWQVHGADVIVVVDNDPQASPPPQADAIITQQAGIALSMRFADCVPLVFFDPVSRAIGLAHAGWRGTVAKVARTTIQTMEAAFGSKPPDIIVGIGPSIGPCCYEVGSDVIDEIETAFSASTDLVRQMNGGSSRPHLDLWRCNEVALREAGVKHIETAGMCTATMTDEFFSHRAEHGNTGRFGVIIALGSES